MQSSNLILSLSVPVLVLYLWPPSLSPSPTVSSLPSPTLSTTTNKPRKWTMQLYIKHLCPGQYIDKHQ